MRSHTHRVCSAGEYLKKSEEVWAEKHVILQNDGMAVSLLLKQLAQAPPVVLRQPCMPRLDAEHLSLLSHYYSPYWHAKLERHRCMT